MPTDKKRLNITLSSELEEAIALMADRDDVPQATKARELMEKGLELYEDEILAEIANKRLEDFKNSDEELLTHEEVWNKVTDDQ